MTGQYYFKNMDKVCKGCGQRLGVHDAEAPYAALDLAIAEKECEGFKK